MDTNTDTATHAPMTHLGILTQEELRTYKRCKGTYDPYYTPGVKEVVVSRTWRSCEPFSFSHHLHAYNVALALVHSYIHQQQLLDALPIILQAWPLFGLRESPCFFVSSEELQDTNSRGSVSCFSQAAGNFGAALPRALVVENPLHRHSAVQKMDREKHRNTHRNNSHNNARKNFGQLADHFYTFMTMIKGLNVLVIHASIERY